MVVFLYNFLWGVVIVVYQVEGGYDVDGKGLLIWDIYFYLLGIIFEGIIGDIVVDYYYCFCEDVVLMVEMGL